MRKNIPWEWEDLDIITVRAKVIGGWIVRTCWQTPDGYCSESMVFIADKDHEWRIAKSDPEKDEAEPLVNPADFDSKNPTDPYG